MNFCVCSADGTPPGIFFKISCGKLVHGQALHLHFSIDQRDQSYCLVTTFLLVVSLVKLCILIIRIMAMDDLYTQKHSRS